MDIEKRIVEIVGDMGLTSATIDVEQRLSSGLDISSLDMLMIISAVEREFDISIDYTKVGPDFSVKDLARLVEAALRGK